MKLYLSLAALLLAPLCAFGQAPQIKVWHAKSYFRTQSTAVSLVRVNSFSPAALNLGFTPDPNFTVTGITAPSSWTCNLGALTCSRANNSQVAYEIIRFIGTIAANGPSTVTNQVTLTGDGLSSPKIVTDTVPVYRPSKVVTWGSNAFQQTTNMPTLPALVAVSQHFKESVALTPDGTIVQWGVIQQDAGPPPGNGFVAIASGTSHHVALHADGHVAAWGRNVVGQLNNVPAGAEYVAISASDGGTVALRNDGRLVAWGTADLTDFPSTGTFDAIATGYQHGLALTSGGTIAQWGANSIGQRNGLPPGGGWAAIACNNYNGIAQRQDGTLFMWGTTSNNPTALLPSAPVVAFGGAGSLNSGSWAMFAEGSIAIWADAFGVYQANKPTTGGYAIGSVALGLNAALVLLPLTDLTLNGGAGQITLVSTAFSTPLSVKVLDGIGNPVQGLSITFTAPGSGPSGTFSNGTASINVNTDASGIASATFTANATAGSYNVTASYPGLNPASIGLTNENPLAVTAINQGGNTPIPPNVLYTPGSGFLVVNFNQQPANVRDTANYLVVGRSDGQDPQTSSCAVLANGDTDIGVSGAVFTAGVNTAKVNFASFPAAMRFKLLVCATNRVNAANSLTGVSGSKLPADSISASFGSNPILAVNGVTQGSAAGTGIAEGASLNSAVTALFVNMNSTPVSSTVSASSVKLFSGSGGSGCSNPATTVSGTASVNGTSIVFTPSSSLFTAGSYQLVVCGSVKGGNGALLGSSGVGSPGADFIRNFTIAQVATTLSKTAGDGQSTVVNTPFGTNLKVTLIDQTGVAISGVPVTFAIVAGGGGAAGSFGGSATVNTGSDGSATAPALTANATAGGFTVTATAGSLNQTFSLTNIGLTGVTITVPAGVGFTLNGAGYTGSQTISLAPGTYTLSTIATQSLGAGTQAVFTGWSDNGALSHSITVTSSAISITGNFKTQYQLILSPAANGSLTPPSGTFYDSDTVVNVTATANSGYYFNGWSGPVASASSSATTVTMTAPATITATFAAQTTPSITWANPANILFGSALGAAQLNAAASVPGTLVYSPAVGTVLPIGAGQTLTVNFTPTDTVRYLPTSKSVSINVLASSITATNLVTTNLLSRDSNTQEIIARITVANTGTATAASVRLTAVRIGSTSTTTTLPVTLGDIAYGQTATATVRIPGSAAAGGAASTVTISGQHGASSAFGGTTRVTVP